MKLFDKFWQVLTSFGKFWQVRMYLKKVLKGWTSLTYETGNTGNFNETGDKRRRQQHEQSLEGCAIAGAALKTNHGSIQLKWEIWFI